MFPERPETPGLPFADEGASCSGSNLARPFPLFVSGGGDCALASAGCAKPGMFSSSKSSSSSSKQQGQ